METPTTYCAINAMDEDTIISELEQPWQRDHLVEVRTGKSKPVFGLPFQSAIFKSVRYGSVAVDKLGCQSDEHAYEFHGGPDKALLQYCSRHTIHGAKNCQEVSISSALVDSARTW